MKLNLERPLLFFDIESTGLNIATDAIAELSFVKVFPDGEERIKTWRVKPWDYAAGRQLPMTPGASAVNGIKDEDLAGCPRFMDIVDEVVSWLADSDLAGFNSAKFDLPMLAEEIERARAAGRNDLDINLHEKRMVDVQTIYHMMEPRNLRAAYRFYCGGKDFENAHSAEADTMATYEVLKAQLDRYQAPSETQQEVLKNDVDALSRIGGRARNVDFAGRLYLNDDGEPTVSFGKHKGRTARDIWENEPSYFAWIENGDFTLDTKQQFARLKKQYQQERKEALNRPATADELAGLASKFNKGKLF